MHLEKHETLEQVVEGLGFLETGAEKDKQMRVTLVTVQHDKIEKIVLNYSFLTPKSWNQFYTNTSVCILHSLDLNQIHRVLCREILRMQMKKLESGGYVNPLEVQGDIFILDGFVASLSIIFSQFVSHERIDYDMMNFRKVFLILDRIKKLDGLLGENVRLNESNEIWEVVDKIFILCKKESSYSKLVEYLSDTPEDPTQKEARNVVLGCDDFVSLRHILNFFGIKGVTNIEEK